MFGDAGLRDVAVESGVIAEGSINRVLEGKQYNRAVRLHKLMYEALMRIIWKGFQVWIESNHPDKGPQIRSTDLKIRSIKEDVCHETLAAALDDDSCVQSFDMFAKYLHFLRTKHGDLARFWMMYIDMVETLLGLIRADREGDWMLHLACVRRVIPWCFAMNKVNYARYLPVYYA
ncbi:hypothetical protein GWK47_039080 [Chionoecetes opilio]|nr:hypothetical protein GWK47_039080 [Chionoecetes opilio]